MDHHCPWINNCCAIGNHKYFLLFVFYTFVVCAYSLSLVVWRFASCAGGSHLGGHVRFQPQQQHQQQLVHDQRYSRGGSGHCLDQPTDLLKILGLLVESFLFGLFTLCMMCDQQGVVRTRITHIDRLKGLELSDGISGFDEVFGIARYSSPLRGTASSVLRKLLSRLCAPISPLVGRGRRKSSFSSTSSLGPVSTALSSTAADADAAPPPSSPFRIDWLSPFSPVGWGGLKDDVLGYCQPISSSSEGDNCGFDPVPTVGRHPALSGGGVGAMQELV
jgi:hypothetical protein